MGSLKDCKLDGLQGSIFMCSDCHRPTAHFTAPGGVPICGYCGATPVTIGILAKRRTGARVSRAAAPVARRKRPDQR